MQVWHADADGWWAQCEPKALGCSPFTVRVSRCGGLQFGNATALPALIWQSDGTSHQVSQCTELRSAQIKPLMDNLPGELLTLLLDNANWQVELSVTCFPAAGVIRVEGSLACKHPASNLTDCQWQWAIPVLAAECTNPIQLYRMQGVRLPDQSSFPVSFLQVCQPLRAHRPQTWRANDGFVASHPTSSNMWVPWLAALNQTGIGAAVGIQWSGLWQAHANWIPAEDKPGHVQVGIGSVFNLNPEPGVSIRLPAAFIAYGDMGLTGLGQQVHSYIRTAVLSPGPDDAFPWVQFNSWYPWRAKLFDHDMEQQLGTAAQLGFEVFVLDDGWFRGWYEGAPWGAGAGWWVEDPAKFPTGIRAFSDKVHAHGLKFGLWIEPERVDTRVLPHTGVRQSWLAGDLDNAPYPPHTSGSGQQLCFGCVETVEWAKRQLDRLIADYGADWIKWDHNRYQVCQRADHGHQAGDGNRAHVLGVYEVLRYLNEQYPHVVVENCAAGGTRVDYGLMQYTHATWLHDIPSPSYRARMQFAGGAQAYPPEYLNAWVVPDDWEPLSEEYARFKLRSCMLGAFGVSYPLPDLSPRIHAILREEIASYKCLRPLMKNGKYVALLPQPTNLAAWSAFAYLQSDEQKASGMPECGVILAFRGGPPSPVSQRLPIPGLVSEKAYRVLDQDTKVERVMQGEELMTNGIEISLTEPNSSALIWLLSE